MRLGFVIVGMKPWGKIYCGQLSSEGEEQRILARNFVKIGGKTGAYLLSGAERMGMGKEGIKE